MNKILQEAADEISNVFALNNGWCDDKRMSVSKILEAVEAKILQTNNNARVEICPVHGDSVDRDENNRLYCVNVNCSYPKFVWVSGKLSPIA